MKFSKKFLFCFNIFFTLIFVSKAYSTGKAPTGEPAYIKCYGVNLENDVKTNNGFYGKRAVVAWLDGNYYGSWFSQGSNEKNNFFEIKMDSNTKSVNFADLKAACVKKLSAEFLPSQIKIVAQYNSISSQYPIIDSSTNIQVSNSRVLDNNQILMYAQAADYVYSIEAGKQDRAVEMPNNFREYNKHIFSTSSSNLHAMSFIDDSNKRVIVAYKGSSNPTDFAIDGQLMLMNGVPQYGTNLASAIKDSLSYYREVISKLKAENKSDYKIVLTGHSLGAFIASLVAVQTGEVARVFSSPATYISSTALSAYNAVSNNYIPFDNVINFARGWDPVVFASGRHIEAMVYYPASNNISFSDPAASHFVRGLIDEIIKMQVIPTHMYVYANTVTGFGLTSSSNFYGPYY